MSNPIILPPLPEPDGSVWVGGWVQPGWIGKSMHAYAAAVTAAKDAEIAQLRAARMAYASEFPLNADGEPDVGNIHANIRAMKERVRVLEDALRGMVIANERHSFLRVGDALTAARAALEKP